MSPRIPLLALLASLSACSAVPPAPPADTTHATPSPAATPPPAAAKNEDPAPPKGLRLPRTAVPTGYTITLGIRPGDDVLRGEMDIDLALNEPTSVIWLNAKDLTVDEAHLDASGKNLPARVVPGGDEVIGLALDAPAQAGTARLHVTYRGVISTKEDHGAFREEDSGNSYVLTQFESTSARRAFPCVDDPGIKVPWQLSLRVPKDLVALANTPVEAEAPEKDGTKLVRFAKSKPLPSYLVAFAVGPFDLVDAGTAGRNKTPVRIAVPRGAQARAAYAKKTTPILLGLLEDYTGIPYPYEKLDVVPIPRTASFGAMENPGLITYTMGGMLAAPEQETAQFRRGFVATMAHELAHQWFGDLVTMDFWEDIWLNEAFASWMGSKTVERFEPAWHEDTRRVQSAAYAMHEDGLLSARKIRQEIKTPDDIVNAFDGITYTKGSAVLAMFEAWAGPEKFQKGVRRYLNEHAYKNATAADFLAAVSAEATPELGPAFATFLDQPGVPVVHAELSCDKGKSPTVRLSQQRWLPAGSTGAPEGTWQLPVCLRYGGGAEGRACTLLSTKTAELPLTGAKQCPAWIALKDGGAGYYRAAYGRAALDTLLDKGRKALTLPERMGIVTDTDALVASGGMPTADALSLLPKMLEEPNPVLERASLGVVWGLSDRMLPGDLRPGLAHFVQKTFGKRAKALGLLPKAGEDDETRMLRGNLLSLVALRGDDAAIVAEARSLTMKWLDDPKAVPDDVAAFILPIAARSGDRVLFDRLRAEAKKARGAEPRRRDHILDALSSFRDPAIVRDALALVLSDELDPREATWHIRQDERMLDLSLDFIEKHFDELDARLPKEAMGFLPLAFSNMCDAKDRDAVARVFQGRVERLLGGPRNLAQALEAISLCDARRRAEEPSLRAFLGKR
jgi:alanyl aminopeptidase